ncbi:MAG: hypothetical protein GKC00_00600, partial [Candidatus Methanofastidiosa archaeon]|nr:hypothetical protein [Candidatus Methanofastidiosa archaeon]
MPGVEVDLNTVGGNILLFILPGLLFSLVGFFLIWIGMHYFKTGILFGTIITENDKASGATWASIIGSLFSVVGLSCVYIA